LGGEAAGVGVTPSQEKAKGHEKCALTAVLVELT